MVESPCCLLLLQTAARLLRQGDLHYFQYKLICTTSSTRSITTAFSIVTITLCLLISLPCLLLELMCEQLQIGTGLNQSKLFKDPGILVRVAIINPTKVWALFGWDEKGWADKPSRSAPQHQLFFQHAQPAAQPTSRRPTARAHRWQKNYRKKGLVWLC